MNARLPSDKALIEAAARLANLPLTAQRAEQLVPVMDDIFQMLDALEQLSLGEAAPAFAYQAKWGD
jgi:Asp-tRNA(Asn)/Glu-tRNA(Gln) amidotransferase C subunit